MTSHEDVSGFQTLSYIGVLQWELVMFCCIFKRKNLKTLGTNNFFKLLLVNLFSLGLKFADIANCTKIRKNKSRKIFDFYPSAKISTIKSKTSKMSKPFRSTKKLSPSSEILFPCSKNQTVLWLLILHLSES